MKYRNIIERELERSKKDWDEIFEMFGVDSEMADTDVDGEIADADYEARLDAQIIEIAESMDNAAEDGEDWRRVLNRLRNKDNRDAVEEVRSLMYGWESERRRHKREDRVKNIKSESVNGIPLLAIAKRFCNLCEVCSTCGEASRVWHQGRRNGFIEDAKLFFNVECKMGYEVNIEEYYASGIINHNVDDHEIYIADIERFYGDWRKWEV